MPGYPQNLRAILRLFFSLFVTGFLACLPANAAPFEQSLQPCVRQVQPGDTAKAMAVATSGFDCTTQQNKLPPGDYWVRLDTNGASSPLSDPAKLRTTSVWMDDFEIHSFYADGHWHQLSVPKSETSKYLQLGALLEFPLESHAAPLDTIVVRVGNAANVRGIMLAPKLISTSKSARDERNLAAYYAAFAGLCVALLVYNMALWRGMRSAFQIAYGAMVASLLLYAFTSSGAAAYVFPELHNQDRLKINYALLSLSAAAALVFIRHFLEDHVLPKWLVRLCWIQSGLVIVTGFSFALLAPTSIRALDLAYFVSFAPIPLLFIATLWFGKVRKSRFVGYMLIAWSAPVIVSFLRLLHGLGFLPYHFMLDNGSLLAMAFEASVSSLAIGQRIRAISHERDVAIRAEQIASQLADADSLTGLLNRRAFVREIVSHPGEWRLTLFDIDHFKWVNDSLGHDGGDEVLVRFASLIDGLAPDDALVARLGGEEFAIATKGNNFCNPDRLLGAIRSTPMLDGYHITASCGSADRILANETDWKLLYKAADTALYRAKSEGRDRHIVSDDAERVAA
jgi:diguanylate cyclase (GGDEF)-like protein